MDSKPEKPQSNSLGITSQNIAIFRNYIHHIRNINTIDANMMKNIRTMSDDEKIHIILALNDVVSHLKELLK
jgi:hypothetical protein